MMAPGSLRIFHAQQFARALDRASHTQARHRQQRLQIAREQGAIMDQPLRHPDQILAQRPLKQILATKPKAVWSVAPSDSSLSAMHLMAEKNIGLVVVLDRLALVGVLSERDCVRRIVLTGKSPEATAVANIMVRDVVTTDTASTFSDCLKLMHAHSIRHLPVVENGSVIAVISIRDLLAEAVAHQARIINDLERERMTMVTSVC